MKQVLVLNAGSGTLKFSVLPADGGAPIAEGTERWDSASDDARAAQFRALVARVPACDAVGHRVVHGGTRFRTPVRIDPDVRRALDEVLLLDPLHMRPALAGIDAVSAALPALPQVAVFDTAFHATMSEAASGYAIPAEWEALGIRRYGFHGLSVDWSASRLRALFAGKDPARAIVAHLGSGCSVTALANGKSADTTMGFSPLEGLVMATRAGSIDPGAILHLQTAHGLAAAGIADALAHRSGLLGVSGISADLREIISAMGSGNPRAQLAYDRFLLSVRRAIGAAAGVLGGCDALVFSGGIGENSARVRRDASLALSTLRLDEPANAATRTDAEISARDSATRAFVILAREDEVVLREVLATLAS